MTWPPYPNSLFFTFPWSLCAAIQLIFSMELLHLVSHLFHLKSHHRLYFCKSHIFSILDLSWSRLPYWMLTLVLYGDTIIASYGIWTNGASDSLSWQVSHDSRSIILINEIHGNYYHWMNKSFDWSSITQQPLYHCKTRKCHLSTQCDHCTISFLVTCNSTLPLVLLWYKSRYNLWFSLREKNIFNA